MAVHSLLRKATDATESAAHRLRDTMPNRWPPDRSKEDMTDRGRGNRAAFARSTARGAKKDAGSTDVARTPLAVRTSGLEVTDDMRARIRTRMGAKLGKYAQRIERLTVRFADENGPRGGIDTVCRAKLADEREPDAKVKGRDPKLASRNGACTCAGHERL